MSALRAGMEARWFRRRLRAQTKRWGKLLQLTPDAPANWQVYVEESSPSPYFSFAANNCFTFANAMLCGIADRKLRTPAGGASPDSVGELVQQLHADGWTPGAPQAPTGDCHLALAWFGLPETDHFGITRRDFHFYRLGPDGWVHKPGDYAARLVEDPVRDALRRGYPDFVGLWTVWHDPNRNHARGRFAQTEHWLNVLTGAPVPVD